MRRRRQRASLSGNPHFMMQFVAAREPSPGPNASTRLVLGVLAFQLLIASHADNCHVVETPEPWRHSALLGKPQLALIAPSLQIVRIRTVLYEANSPVSYLQMVLANDSGLAFSVLAALDSDRFVLRRAHLDFSSLRITDSH